MVLDVNFLILSHRLLSLYHFHRCVPGVFFDINPRGVKQVEKSNCIANVRFSYGPSMRNLTVGMKNLAEMIAKWSKNPERASVYALEAAKRVAEEFANEK